MPRRLYTKVKAVLAAAAALTAVASAAAPGGGHRFEKLGVMIDVSRGRVLKPGYLKTRLEHLRAFGYNAVMLYTEDTFKMEGLPKWGYMSGGYTMDEIREIKAFTDRLGMEFIPCIETLGHLEKVLRWSEYAQVRNTGSTLLVGEEQTYALIGRMLEFWRQATGAKRIHLNMDEAYGFAEGRCKWLPGEQTRFDVFLRHLKRVNELCLQHGFVECIVAGDAFYRVATKSGEYYEPDTVATPELRARVPKNVRLVYWDYYHNDRRHCEGMIDGHASFGSEPIIYGGIQNWYHFLVDREKTLGTMQPLIAAARAKRCREIFFTLWGDDGAYGIPDVSEEGLFACAELAQGRTAEPTDENCERFKAITGLDYRSLVKLGEVCRHYGDEWPDMIHEPSILYDDPLYCGNYRNYLVRKPSESESGRYYRQAHYYTAVYKDAAWRDRGDLVLADHRQVLAECARLEGVPESALALVKTLGAKLDYERDVLEAWRQKDRDTLERIAVRDLPALALLMRRFDEVFRAEWYRTSQPFGYERIQKRNAAQLARLEEARRRLREYLDGQTATIEELDETLKPFGRFEENPVIGW